jgi:hypothetical protein
METGVLVNTEQRDLRIAQLMEKMMETTIEWMDKHFAQVLGCTTTTEALEKGWPMVDPAKTTKQRIAGGFVIVTEDGVRMQFPVKAGAAVCQQGKTLKEALVELKQNWTGEPVVVMSMAKKALPLSNIRRSVDLRKVAVCSAEGVRFIDMEAEENSMVTMG